MYLDKQLIKNIYSSIENINFDADIIEYSFQDSKHVSDDFDIIPNYNNIYKCNDKNSESKNDLGIKFNKSSKYFYSTSTEKKFVNINTISDIKNISFYDKLIKKLENSKEKNLFIENGEVFPYKLINKFDCKIDLKNNQFFILKNNIVWINGDFLEDEFLILCNLVCNVNVVGFIINDSCDKKIIKALAIYIE